jgi:hypothetical protein
MTVLLIEEEKISKRYQCVKSPANGGLGYASKPDAA